jgi:phosphoserine phosphatase RsbU/P
MSRMKRIALLVVPAILLPVVYGYDVVQAAVELEISSFAILRELFVLLSFTLLGLYLEIRQRSSSHNAPKQIGRVFAAVIVALLFAGIGLIFHRPDFSGQGSMSIHRSVLFLFSSTMISLVMGMVMLYALFVLRDLILFKRRKSTRRYYFAYLIFLFAACATEIPFLHLNDTLASSIVFPVTILLMVVNSFKQNWIVYLSKREKIYSIVYSILLFIALILLNVYLAIGSGTFSLVAAYSRPLNTFIQLNALFGTMYFGVTFFSVLFHLPTAEVFERKQSELNSLHNLSRLVAQVFDFNDLVNTVTQMTSEVCGAQSVWLELFSTNTETGDLSVQVVAKKDITDREINLLGSGEGTHLRQYLVDTQKVLLVEDIWSDRRTKYLKKNGFARGSLLTVPLLSHGKLIGVLHATKDFQNGFDQDDIDVMTTFADHVSIAIENSRLIAKSIERERLHQEMMVAQRMQKRLLPQKLPQLPSVEFAAVSESSFEVGGDYYDVITLPNSDIGIVVGDVSGKGVSAAFYMAEVKGIVHTLSKLCSEPRELLLRANETLMESLEKNAFISAVYGVLNIPTATLTLARAGHCPVIYISGVTAELVKSTGIGLGLTNGLQFEQATEQRTIILKRGDICIFYTDGITEARNETMEEYGSERLIRIAAECKNCSAEVMKDTILRSVRTFMGQRAYTDDVTLVVMKWLGSRKE